jgi:hypothetical protein
MEAKVFLLVALVTAYLLVLVGFAVGVFESRTSYALRRKQQSMRAHPSESTHRTTPGADSQHPLFL